MKRIVYGIVAVVIAAGGFGYYKYRQATGTFVVLNPESIAAMQAETATQDENAFAQPAPQPAVLQAPSKNKNLYFGDLHVHTDLSFDSYLFGNRNTLEQAYAFAKGEPLSTVAGEQMQLSRPLDFVGITDHAETFGMMDICMNSTEMTDSMRDFCSGFDNPSLGFFMKLRSMGEKRPLEVPDFMCEKAQADCLAETRELGRPMWEMIKAKAEEHNNPGAFTAFAAYEYSPPLTHGGKHHRNIYFRNEKTSTYAYSAHNARTAPILWQMLEADCSGDCEFLTIPHNMNKTWGLAYAQQTIDGDPYTEEDWARRVRYEPLAEMYQNKGASECATGVGTTDEECAFEQFYPVCKNGENLGCITPTSMVRDGLKIGLQMEQQQGINPFHVGFIGSTDTHNSNPGDVEEYDYRGVVGVFSSPATKRLNTEATRNPPIERNPGGLAAIWATENTRDALFDSMQRREAYATSGTRISLRFFAGPGYTSDMVSAPRGIARAYDGGEPMGSDLQLAEGVAPSFIMLAAMDPMTVPLDRVQVIKGWVKDGEHHERVRDVACSDGRSPGASGRCADLVADVDLTNCAPAKNKGAPQLAAAWTDADYDPAVKAFYYVRVLEIPTCRWTTYDALRLDRTPVAGAPATHRERAWSSPIWVETRS